MKGDNSTMSKLKRALKVITVLGACGAAVLVQQILTFWFTLKNIIPSGMAKHSYHLKHGVVTLDHERTISLFDLPLAGKGMLIGSLAGVGVLILSTLYTREKLKDTFALHVPDWRASFPWLVAFVVAGALFAWLEHLIPAFKSEAMTNMIRASSHQPVMAILGAGVAVPLFEEFLFRGLLFGHLERTFSSAISVVTTSILFALLHVQYELPLMLGILCVGLLLGMIRWKSGSIWPGTIIHALNNTTAILMVMSTAP